MTRLIHTGDTHIGYQQYHSPARREDFLSAFRQVLEDAVADDVDAVVHAGDLFHDRRPGLPDLLGTMDALRVLDRADIPFLAIVGNHEAKREGQWLDLFERMDLATRLDAEGTEVGAVTLYGLDYVPRSRRDDLDLTFADPATEHAALVAHGLFEPFPHGEWDTEALLAETSLDLDALLLGDNHHPDRAEVTDTWVTYCGSTERVSAAEREDRGYNIVEFDTDGVHLSRRGLADTRDFAFVDAELAPDEGLERVRDMVAERDLEDSVVIVTVEGEGDPVDAAAVESFALEQGALVARVTDRREIQDEREVPVQFADPDAAVRERLRDLGLSDAARSIDETVRDATVADSNVRESVESRVRELLEEDPAALEPAEDPVEDDETAGSTADPDGPTSDDLGLTSKDVDPRSDDVDPRSDDVDPRSDDVDPPSDGAPSTPEDEDPASTAADQTSSEADSDEGSEPEAEVESEPEAEVESEPEADQSEEDAATAGQASMEEYL